MDIVLRRLEDNKKAASLPIDFESQSRDHFGRQGDPTRQANSSDDAEVPEDEGCEPNEEAEVNKASQDLSRCSACLNTIGDSPICASESIGFKCLDLLAAVQSLHPKVQKCICCFYGDSQPTHYLEPCFTGVSLAIDVESITLADPHLWHLFCKSV